MNYVVVGLNHKTAPVEVREKVAFDAQKSSLVIDRLLKIPFLKEVTVISTCNRVELYSATQEPESAEEEMTKIFSESHDIQDYLYCKKDQEAVNHLFSVVSSVDSMIAGENQITNQVKLAYDLAFEKEATDTYLNKLFHRAFYVAKRVKTETELGKGSVSVGSAAVMLANKIYGSLQNKSVLLLGAGEVGELVIRYLNSQKAKEIFIMNRTFEKAQKMEAQGLGEAKDFNELEKLLPEVDILITSLSFVIPELDRAHLKAIMQKRKNDPLFVIDLGVPRNIPEDVSEINNLYLYNIDDLQGISTEGMKKRAGHIQLAQSIIDEEASLFYEAFLGHQTLPTIASLGQKFEMIRRKELEKAVSRMPDLSKDHIKTIDKLTQSLINRVLHDPILSLKNKKEMSEPGILSLIQKIFKLSDEG